LGEGAPTDGVQQIKREEVPKDVGVSEAILGKSTLLPPGLVPEAGCSSVSDATEIEVTNPSHEGASQGTYFPLSSIPFLYCMFSTLDLNLASSPCLYVLIVSYIPSPPFPFQMVACVMPHTTGENVASSLTSYSESFEGPILNFAQYNLRSR